MPFRPGTHGDLATFHHEGVEVDAFFLGLVPVWCKAAGSAAVDIVLGPVREVGSPSQLRIVRCTIAGTPFPRWIRLEGQHYVGFGELTLQNDMLAESGTRRTVEITLVQDIDNTPTDTPLNFRVRASNGRTQDSASFTTQFEQR